MFDPVLVESRTMTYSPKALKVYSLPSKVIKWRLPYTMPGWKQRVEQTSNFLVNFKSASD